VLNPAEAPAGIQSIERRLAIGCSWFGAAFSAVGTVSNAALGMSGILVWACALAAAGFAANAWLGHRGVSSSRVSIGFLVVAGLLITSTWEANGGVRSSTTTAVSAAMVFAVLALPGRHATWVIVSTLGFFLVLSVIELWDGKPAEIPFVGMDEALDAVITTLATATLCGVGVAMMRRVYDRNLAHLREANARIEELAGRAMAADREKSRFLARMSHDLRTPLAAVLGSLEIATRDEALRPDLARLLGAARERCFDLERIISDLLDIGLVEAGALNRHDSAIILADTLTAVAAEARPKPGVAIRTRIADDVPRALLTDGTRLRQALGNLVGNACKHTDHGEITLSASRNTNRLLIAISDTGPGIAASDLDRLRQPYTQLPRGQERGGSGLGLYIADEITRLLDGRLQIHSVLGKGTTTELDLPLVEVAGDPQVGERAHKELAHPSVRVLVADDEPVLRMTLEAMFEALGCQVDLAEDGAQAIARAVEKEFELIFLDIHMPQIDGLEAARRIRDSKPSQRIVALTANAYPADIERAIAAGMDDFLAKPVTLELLAQTLARWIPARTGGATAGS
jgi:two-component system, sensor histidine kinase